MQRKGYRVVNGLSLCSLGSVIEALFARMDLHMSSVRLEAPKVGKECLFKSFHSSFMTPNVTLIHEHPGKIPFTQETDRSTVGITMSDVSSSSNIHFAEGISKITVGICRSSESLCPSTITQVS
jgi:hypothetical protein